MYCLLCELKTLGVFSTEYSNWKTFFSSFMFKIESKEEELFQNLEIQALERKMI